MTLPNNTDEQIDKILDDAALILEANRDVGPRQYAIALDLYKKYATHDLLTLIDNEVTKARIEIPEPLKARKRLNRLKRRAEWLRSQSESTPDRTDISHTRAELSSLDWGISIIEAHLTSLLGDNDE